LGFTHFILAILCAYRCYYFRCRTAG